jgi:hypothetical protein
LCNFKPVDEYWDKIMFDQQMNVGRINIENVFGILKIRWRIFHCIYACVDRTPTIVMVYYVLHHYCQLMGLPPPPKGFQEDPFCCVKGQVPLLHEGRVAPQCGEATFFTNWMIVHANSI